jgi:hypothetical protein
MGVLSVLSSDIIRTCNFAYYILNVHIICDVLYIIIIIIIIIIIKIIIYYNYYICTFNKQKGQPIEYPILKRGLFQKALGSTQQVNYIKKTLQFFSDRYF